MDGLNEEIVVWNKVASRYEERFMNLQIYDETYSFFTNHLTLENSAILELGCGPGNITAALLKINPKLQVLATDYASNMVELAKKNNPQIEAQVLDAKDILLLNQKFDGIVAGFIAPYLNEEELSKFFHDSCARLNDEGLFYVSFVAGESSQSGYQTSPTGDRLFFNFHPLENLTKSLERYKFNLLQIFHVPYEKASGELEEHTIIISRKR